MNRFLLLIVLTLCSCRSAAVSPGAGVGDGRSIDETFGGDLARAFACEGPPGTVLRQEDGTLLIDPRPAAHRPGGIEGFNLWLRRPLPPGDCSVEWEIEPIAPRPDDGSGEKCNLLFMIDCGYVGEEGREDLPSAPRTGHYFFLHGEAGAVRRYEALTGQLVPPMRGYTLTYYRIEPDAPDPYAMVLRKNPGFHLLHRVEQCAADLPPVRHVVRIERRGGTIRAYQKLPDEPEERLIFDHTDETTPALSGGHAGFRTWRCAVRLYRVTVHAPPE